MKKRKSIMLLLTYNCNLRCSYCYEPKKRKHKMTFESAQKFILEQLSLAKDTYDSFEIQFMGGEPLMEFALIQRIANWIWESKPYNKEYILFAQTNGTLLDKAMKEWFGIHKLQFILALSMDGTMQMQNINRSHSYRLVDTDFFIRNWPTQNVKMTISPNTIDTLSDGVKFLHKIGFKYIAADLAMGPTIKWNADNLKSYKKELDRLVSFYMENIDIIPFSMLRLDPIGIMYEESSYYKTCSCGEDLVCIDWDGKTYACHLFSPISVSRTKAELSNVLYDFSNHEQFISETCKGCKLQTICNRCYGMNYICTNNISEPSPFHCNAFKIRFFAACKLYLLYSEYQNDITSVEKIKRLINTLKK